jgi:hypothetical protein
MFICKKCGMLLDDDSAYCPICDPEYTSLKICPIKTGIYLKATKAVIPFSLKNPSGF